jgi:hypothetical protein
MDPATLALGLSAFLAPALPYLLKGGEEAAKEAGKKFGDAVWGRAQDLWGRLRLKVEAKPAAVEAAEDVAKAPDREQARSALAWQLEKLLKEDPTLAADLARRVEESRAAGVNVLAYGERSVAAGGNIGTAITGDTIEPRRRPRRR